jgi:hypothetical protein
MTRIIDGLIRKISLMLEKNHILKFSIETWKLEDSQRSTTGWANWRGSMRIPNISKANFTFDFVSLVLF